MEDTQPKPMQFRDIPLDKIVPNSWNPNEHDPATFDRLVQELTEVGYIDPIQVVEMADGNYRILGGEHRWTAAKVLGWESMQAVVLTDAKWQDEDLQKFVTVRLNMLRGKTNPDKFIKIYDDMAAKYGADALQALFAYTDTDAWNKLTKDIGKGLKQGLPPELGKKFEEAVAEVKSVDGLSSILNHLFAKYGNTLDHSYMVFTYGGKEHCYVEMDKETKRAVDVILAHCQEQSQNINDVISPALREASAALKS